MRWLQTEYILKGVYLGLLFYVALLVPKWEQTAWLATYTFGALALAVAVAGYHKLREGFQIRGRVLSFILFLLLENPFLVYAGIVLGLALGAHMITPEEQNEWIFPGAVVGGALLGYLFWFLEHVRDRRVRLGLSLALAVLLGGGTIYWAQELLGSDRTMFAVLCSWAYRCSIC